MTHPPPIAGHAAVLLCDEFDVEQFADIGQRSGHGEVGGLAVYLEGLATPQDCKRAQAQPFNGRLGGIAFVSRDVEVPNGPGVPMKWSAALWHGRDEKVPYVVVAPHRPIAIKQRLDGPPQ
jgi:hypothetical protein